MRIAFFTDTYLPNVDGVVTSMLNYRKDLERRGHKVYVFSSGDSAARKMNRDPRVFFYRSIPFPPYPQYKLALFPFTATRSVKENCIELVHSHAVASMGLAALATAKRLHLPLIGTYHTMLPQATSYLVRRWFSERLAKKIAWSAVAAFYLPFDAVTAPSRIVQKMLAEHGVKSAVEVPNGVDTQRFNPGLDGRVVRKLLELGKDEKLVLVAGRLGFEKNVDVVIKAAQLVLKGSKAKFVVTGDGPARKQYEKLVLDEGLSDDFVFTGFVGAEELPFYYAAADCFATASTFETQGLALLEAMACGVPCVGADSLAIPEAVRDGKNGFLFEPGDEVECAEKILAVLGAKEAEKRRMRKAARLTAEEYSIEKSTAKLLKVYRKLL